MQLRVLLGLFGWYHNLQRNGPVLCELACHIWDERPEAYASDYVLCCMTQSMDETAVALQTMGINGRTYAGSIGMSLAQWTL